MKRALNFLSRLLKDRKISGYIFVIVMMGIPIIHFLIFNIGIHIKTILMTFQTRDSLINDYVFLKGDIFANYKEIIKAFFDENGGLGPALKNSIKLFLMNDFIMIPSSLIMAYIFYKKSPFERFYRVVFYIPLS